MEQLARLPVPPAWRIAALETWSDQVGAQLEYFERAIVAAGIHRVTNATAEY